VSEWRDWDGARWWKFDFHTHTPASHDWRGAQDLQPRDWLLKHMRAGMDCVAVTDHNTGAWVDDLKSALEDIKREKPEGYRDLAIFPGVEISVQGGVHLLAIFDPEFQNSDVTDIVARTEFMGTRGDTNGETKKAFFDVVNVIREKDGLAIPAHVDRESGLFKKMTGRTLRQALEAGPIYAMEVVKSNLEKPGLYSEMGLNWTEVCGSDSHCMDNIGRRFSWIKMGAPPSLEGLRLALLDGNLAVWRFDSCSGDPNEHGRNVIEAVEIEKAQYMGRSEIFKLNLNPWFNAVIGGRGTGKSTLVEFMRTALRREDEIPLSLEGEFQKYRGVRRSRQGEGLLTENSKISILYRKDGERFWVRWGQSGDPAPISREDGSQVFGDVKNRFPAKIYSQKQIFEISQDPLSLLGHIDMAPKVEKLAWEENHEKLERRYHELRATQRRLESSLQAESGLVGELEDVERKLRVFEEQGHAGVLREYRQSRRQRHAIERWEETWSDVGARIRDLAAGIVPEQLESFLDPEDSMERLQNRDMRQAHRVIEDLRKVARERLFPAADEADRIAREWKDQFKGSAAVQRERDAEIAHEALLEKLSEGGVSDPGEYAELVQRKQQIEEKIAEIKRQHSELEKVSREARAILSELSGSNAELARRRKEFLEEVLCDNPYIKIEIVPQGAPKLVIEQEFRKMLNREEGGFDRDIDALLDELDKAGNREQAVEQLKARMHEIADSQGEAACVQDQRFATHIRRLRENQPEILDRLDVWYPKDGLNVSYSPMGDGCGFQSIETGSPGQRTAALLAFLMSYGDDPIILDQPEDDLDNALISDLIVKQLREMKQKRQVIVVTHNSNIVVNGDAELISALWVAGGETRHASGCLQDQEIRDKICEIMEGGRDAFEQRYERIHGKGSDA